MLFTSRDYTEISMIKTLLGHRDSFIPHSRVQYNFVWSRPPICEISTLLNRNPLKASKKSKIFFAICLNLLIHSGH